MNVIDLYVELLDEKGCNKALSFFGDSTKGNIKLKRVQLRKYLKRQLGNPSKKGAPDPFHFVVEKQKLNMDNFELDQEEKKFMLLEDRFKNKPDYIKLATLYYYFPDYVERHLDEFAERHLNGLKPFVFDYPFKTDVALLNYIKNTALFIIKDGNKLRIVINEIVSLLPEEDKLLYKTILQDKAIKTFMELYEEVRNEDDEKRVTMHQLAFAQKNADFDSDFNYLAVIDFLHTLLLTSKIDNAVTTKSTIRIEELELEVANLEAMNQEIKNDKKNKERQASKALKDSEKKQIALKKSIDEMGKQIIDMKLEIEELDSAYKNQMESNKNFYETQILELKKESTSIINKIENIKDEIATTSTENKIFVIIHCFDDVEIASAIFPEVSFIHSSRVKKDIDIIKSIRIVYIQRSSMTTTVIQQFKTKAKLFDVFSEVRPFTTMKEMIEDTSIIKNQIGGRN